MQCKQWRLGARRLSRIDGIAGSVAETRRVTRQSGCLRHLPHRSSCRRWRAGGPSAADHSSATRLKTRSEVAGTDGSKYRPYSTMSLIDCFLVSTGSLEETMQGHYHAVIWID